MKNIFILLAVLSIATSCNKKEEEIIENVTHTDDYNKYLELDQQALADTIKTNIREIRQELGDDTTRVGTTRQLATELDRLFDLTGNVDYLNEAADLRELASRNTYIKKESGYRSIAQTYIKQHRFKEADSLMRSFTQDYSSTESQLVQFDVAMELGEYSKAEDLLESLRNPNDYSYLIRAAKWNDHIGQLGTTIKLMERALKLANESGNQSLQLWSYSNIADYYGHDGQIQKSYDHYLKTLEMDPTNTYALKGIAWIAYSNDNDPEEARAILTKLKERHAIPDYDLELAELEDFEERIENSNKLKNEFMNKVDNAAYGAMYNAYKINELIDLDQASKALSLARQEIENRPTPEIYDLLGYALLETGDMKQALENHRKHVIGKTFEPKALYHTALILKANDLNDEAQKFKKELLDTEYEMGPVTYKKIQKI